MIIFTFINIFALIIYFPKKKKVAMNKISSVCEIVKNETCSHLQLAVFTENLNDS